MEDKQDKAGESTEYVQQVIEENKAEWFKAGGMAERILIDWEMKRLKEKLREITDSHNKLAHQLKEANEVLEIKNKQITALGDRISMLTI